MTSSPYKSKNRVFFLLALRGDSRTGTLSMKLNLFVGESVIRNLSGHFLSGYYCSRRLSNFDKLIFNPYSPLVNLTRLKLNKFEFFKIDLKYVRYFY